MPLRWPAKSPPRIHCTYPAPTTALTKEPATSQGLQGSHACGRLPQPDRPGPWAMARALLLMWAAAAALHAAAAPVIRPSELFMPGGLPKGQQIALLPQWALLGVPLGPSLPGVPSASACATRCREALPRCSFFNYCPLGTAVSYESWGPGPRRPRRCRCSPGRLAGPCCPPHSTMPASFCPAGRLQH